MTGLNVLKPAYGARHRRKIVGRGEGSGHGGTATRGMKGQRSRSGDGKMIGFEGGQMPLVRRIPKRGFTSQFARRFAVVNLNTLDQVFAAGSEVTPDILRKQGIVKDNLPVKILGTGTLSKVITVKCNAFSHAAIEKIKAAGGSATVIEKA